MNNSATKDSIMIKFLAVLISVYRSIVAHILLVLQPIQIDIL